jgi:hypothetical protein
MRFFLRELWARLWATLMNIKRYCAWHLLAATHCLSQNETVCILASADPSGLGSVRELALACLQYTDLVSNPHKCPNSVERVLSAGNNTSGLSTFNHQARGTSLANFSDRVLTSY